MRVMLGMSGGVDSSVAAYLLKKDGYECVGATLKLYDNEQIGIDKTKTCCSLKDVEDAKSVAFKLDMRHYVFNFRANFEENVIKRFVQGYEKGSTPNPCIDCNKYIKFDQMLARARMLEFDYIATGHYARVEYDEKSHRYLLKKAVDFTKDQSYVLYMLTQDQLAHTLFPLGGLTKQQVREIAQQQGFLNAKKHDSQDICFVPDGRYVDFIEHYTSTKSKTGDFMDLQGNVLGKHKGIWHYTIGQGKRLGIALGKHCYVVDKNAQTNTVTLGDKQDLYCNGLIATDVNLISVEKLEKPMSVTVKTRYKQVEIPATISMENDNIKVTFDNPVLSVTNGQAVVFYDGDVVVGGGTISSKF